MKRLIVAVVAVLCVGAGCSDGGNDASTPESSALTLAQATALSGVLTRNLDSEGAVFAANLGDGTLTLTGEVDWVDHMGHAMVQATGSESAVTEVFWSESFVVERRPDLEGRTVGGLVVPAFVAREPDVDGRQLDNLIGFVTALASRSADNPLLVQQRAGSAWLGDTDIDGVAVSRFRYGQQVEYWLAKDDDRLLRVVGDNAISTRPFTIDLGERGQQSVVGPTVEEVIEVSEIEAIYTPAAS